MEFKVGQFVKWTAEEIEGEPNPRVNAIGQIMNYIAFDEIYTANFNSVEALEGNYEGTTAVYSEELTEYAPKFRTGQEITLTFKTIDPKTDLYVFRIIPPQPKLRGRGFTEWIYELAHSEELPKNFPVMQAEESEILPR